MRIYRPVSAVIGITATAVAVYGNPLRVRDDSTALSDPFKEARKFIEKPPGQESYKVCSSIWNACLPDDGVEHTEAKSSTKFDPYKKRTLAYWPIYDGLLLKKQEYGDPITAIQDRELQEHFDEQQLDGLTHLILFGVDARSLTSSGEIDWLPAWERAFDREISQKARAKGIHVMVAIGGWDIDTMFKAVTNEAEARNLGKHIAKFADANGFDGIDIDHEYPTAQQAESWPFILDQIRQDAPNLLLSVALPGDPHTAPENDKENPFAGWEHLLPKFAKNEVIDFYNVMTYDLVNGYSEGHIAYHHASLSGAQRTVKRLEALGLEKSRLNTGFPLYAKYFPMSTCANNAKRLDCKLDNGFAPHTANALRFDENKNTKLTNCLEKESDWSEDDRKLCKPNKKIDELYEQARRNETIYQARKNWFKNNVALSQVPTKNYTTYDDKALADSFWDADSKTFWTWQSPYAIAQTCEAMKKEDIGGQFLFALGQDSKDLVHIEAFQGCVKEWAQAK